MEEKSFFGICPPITTHFRIERQRVLYQTTTLKVKPNTKISGLVYFVVDSKKYLIGNLGKTIQEDALDMLYEALRRQLDINYMVRKTGDTITIVNIFAKPAKTIFFQGEIEPLIDIDCIEESRDLNIPVLDSTQPNQIIIIDDLYDFGGGVLDIPDNSTLLFQDGGYILNAHIIYNNTLISNQYNIINCICEGKLANSEVTPEMFGAISLNFADTLYDISIAIQNSLDSGNYNILINNDSNLKYEWRHTVKLYDSQKIHSIDPSIDLWNVCIKGTNNIPFNGPGAWYRKFTIIIYATTAFKCYEGDFDFSNTPWPTIYMSNLSFLFAYSLSGTIFFDGILSHSKIDSISICNCYRLINGGLKLASLITNSTFEICEYAFGGYMVDSKIENCYFTAFRKKREIEPVLYMNSIEYGGQRIIGSHVASIYTNNYVDFFYTIFVIGNTWDDGIITNGNTFDIFKYFAQCKYWIGQNIVDKSFDNGCPICSNSDLFRRCNNLSEDSNQSTDKLLRDRVDDPIKDSVFIRKSIDENIEIYSVLGKFMHGSSFQINSVFDETIDYIFAKDKATNVSIEEVTFVTSPSFCFKAKNNIMHSGEFICGGKASMYAFQYLSSSTSMLIPYGIKYRRPMFFDLQDMTVTEFPTDKLFDGRRIIYNNKIYTFKQSDARDVVGTWQL